MFFKGGTTTDVPARHQPKHPNKHPSLTQQTLQTSRAALRNKNRAGSLIKQRTGAAFYSVTRNIPPPYTLKTRYFLPLLKKQEKAPHTGFYGSIQLREKLKFANFCRNISRVRSLWGRRVAAKVLQLLLLTIIARWEAKACKLLPRLCHVQKLRQKLSGGTSANHAKHLHPLTHARRPSPATHRPEIPTDERPSQNTLATRWIACDGPAE